MGYSPWGLKEWDTTERVSMHTHTHINTFTAFSLSSLNTHRQKVVMRGDGSINKPYCVIVHLKLIQCYNVMSQ